MMMDSIRYDLVKLDSAHCWMCGELFNEKVVKSNHHSIPDFLKPKRNVIIPVCLDCHKILNMYCKQQIPKLKTIKGMVENMEKFVEKYKKVVEKYDSEKKEKEDAMA
jgi:hypothetical protein